MNRFRLFLPVLLWLSGTGWTLGGHPPQSLARQVDLDLDRENMDSWRQHILPGDADLAWQNIPWLTTFADGIAAAHESDKPLLLWTMNGHPLGCT